MQKHSRPVILFFTAFLTIFVLSACSVPAPTCDQANLQYPNGSHLQGDTLRLGVVDASPYFLDAIPGALRDTQASVAVIDDVRWGYIQPNPPQNGPDYQWNEAHAALDARVAAYQAAGFELVMVLRAWNPWARSAAPQGGLAAVSASTPPQAEYLDDYAAWVQAVVERYDADGIDDFPGLLDVDGDGQPDPVRYFQIETDATTGVWWQGNTPETTAADYLTLLRTAAAAVRAASPQARVLLAGPTASDLLDRDPSAAELQDIVADINPAVCGALTAFQQYIAATDAYDIIAVHSIADYTGLGTLGDWVATLNQAQKPVWITGATTAPALTGDPQMIATHPLFPATGEALWNSLQDYAAADHEEVVNWYQTEQARLAFKKVVVAAASGFHRLILGYEQDRPGYQNPDYGLRDLAFQGMLDDPGAGSPGRRPVVYALATARAHFGDYSAVRRLIGWGPDIYAYEFMVEGQPVVALWYDDGQAQGPSDPPASRTIQLLTPETSLTLFTIPTHVGETSAQVQILHPEAGVVSLTLGETPVIIRGQVRPPAQSTLFLPYVVP